MQPQRSPAAPDKSVPRTSVFLAGVLLVFGLNVWIAWRLFFIDYLPYFESVEGAFHGFARFISEHWGNLTWMPTWYEGIPFQNVYVPLLHVSVAALHSLTGITIGHSYHAVTALMYTLGPVAAIVMLRQLGASRAASLSGAAVWSIFSLSSWLLVQVARDLGSQWYMRRLQVLVAWGEGPHVSAMAFQCLAVGALEYALRKSHARAYVLAGIATAAVILTNTPATGGLILSMGAWLIAQPSDRLRGALKVLVICGTLGYLFSAWAVPPSHIATVLQNSGEMHTDYSPLGVNTVALVLTVAGLLGAGWALRRTRIPLVLRFLLLEGALFAVVSLTAGEHFEMVPQAGRLHLEMDRAFALGVGVLIVALYEQLRPRWRPVLVAVAAVLFFFQLTNVRHGARGLLRSADPTPRSEYKTAMWLEQNAPGERVFTPGSTGFWLNAFADSPQLIGCCAQSRSHHFVEDVAYLVNVNETEMQRGIDWMRIYGVGYLVVAQDDSTDTYRDIHSPMKFEPLLPRVADAGGNYIYSLGSQPTLAHIVRPGEWFESTPPGVMDVDPAPLAAIAADPARALNFRWRRNGEAFISGKMGPGDLAWVQVSYLPGWVATVNGEPRPVKADGLGMLVVEPRCDGACEIHLEFQGVPDLFWGRLTAGLALAGALGVVLWELRRRG